MSSGVEPHERVDPLGSNLLVHQSRTEAKHDEEV
ncbi:hypothetical protein J2S34_002424 [Nitrobacter winogradskyi]|uniref:Uncharacterized protein n=1 Tax=Nitrobacter winogradskyi TaxID=913 RepID=A0ACC6AL01_NITWI|nr:hypothetical protein [Nitrobacter winogradskyi]